MHIQSDALPLFTMNFSSDAHKNRTTSKQPLQNLQLVTLTPLQLLLYTSYIEWDYPMLAYYY